jgi:formylglycine-generating enzyme required for sulfatase activity
MPLAAARAHTLPTVLGYHTVRVQYLDGANNYSPVYNDYINLVGFSAGTSETVMLPGSVPLEMMWIPAGTFMMGRYVDEQDSNASESPQHAVTLSGFWMGKYELTKAQWTAVMSTVPWKGLAYVLDDPDSPAIYMSWNSAQAFLTQVNSDTGKTFRLPSEAQWEYACRAGTLTRFYWGDDPGYSDILDYAWCYDNAGSTTDQQYAHESGQKLPNAFGLYDMSGNTWEWCQDWWHADYTGAPTDGSAWESPAGTSRLIRGGAWNFNGPCTSDYRSYSAPGTSYHSFGFRVVQIP